MSTSQSQDLPLETAKRNGDKDCAGQDEESTPNKADNSAGKSSVRPTSLCTRNVSVRKLDKQDKKSKAVTAKSTSSGKAKTAPIAKKSTPSNPRRASDSSVENRFAQLEQLVEKQSAENDKFRQTIIAAISGQWTEADDGASTLADCEDLSDMEIENPEFSDVQSADKTVPSHGADTLSLQSQDSSAPTCRPSPKHTNSQQTVDLQSKKQQDKGFAASFAVGADMGDPIRSDVANSLNFALVEKLEDKCLQDTIDKYKCPQNCEALVVPKVNPQIWENINSQTRSRDLKLQRVQKPLIKGLTALAKACEGPCSVEQEHGLLLLATANFELNNLRKDLIKPDLNPRYAHLCKPSNKVSTHLFGDDLGKQIKELQDEQKATFGVLKNFKPGQGRSRYQPYTKNSGTRFQLQAALAGWRSNSNPFLGNTHNLSKFRGKPQLQSQRRKATPTNQQRQEFSRPSLAAAKK